MVAQSSVRVMVLAIALTVVGLAVALLAFAVGSAELDLRTVVDVILRRLNLITGEHVSEVADRIVWQLRAPRIVGAAAVGASLAVCGVILQSLTRNELADPYLLGISSGASVGAVVVIVFGVTIANVPIHLMVTVAAFLGALAVLFVVLGLATGRSGSLPPGRTILAGVALSQLCGAFTSLAIMVFSEREVARLVMAWTLGSLSGVRWENAAFLIGAAAIALIALLLVSNTLDAFAFGEVAAGSLGVRVNRARWALLVATALITASTVAFVGPIGFVGLTVPHLVRLIVGPSHRALLPLAALGGAVLMLIADTLAQTVRPDSEIPIGIVTAVIGAPLFIILLRRQAVRS